jgi:beta-glucanase (GH16 family)
MAQVIEDRVRETTTSTGTGDITLTGAVRGFRSFSSVCSANDTVYCCIVAVDQNGLPTGDWEVGNYTYVSANTLARTVVLSSSNDNLHVNFAAGTKHIFLDLAAYQINQFAKAGQTAPTTGTPGVWPVGISNPANTLLPMSFNDEFNGTTLDSANWHDRIWYRSSATSIKNYKVAGGNLMIWPVEDPNASSSIKHDGTNFIKREIVSHDKRMFQYGFFEARMRLPYGRGLWPAFWLLHHQLDDMRPEIDIMEAYTSATLFGWSSNNRPLDYAGTTWNDRGRSDDLAGEVRMFGGTGSTLPQVDLSADFHVYGCQWDSGGVRFYFDGQIVGANRYDNGKMTTKDEIFRIRPMYILFDVWYGGNGQPDPDSTTPQGEGNSLLIDYVRVWPIKT